MESWTERRVGITETRQMPYVAHPIGLLADLADSPVAIGVYTLIGRRYAIRQTPIPLSANDVLRFDGTLTYGAAVRALERLASSGWVIEERRAGWKSTYVPTWGRVKGTLVPWQIGTARNGRPTHVHQIPIDARIVDSYIGRIEPHERHPAQITRYLTAPLLSLRDVGVYVLARSGRVITTAALERWGLVHHSDVLDLMSDDELVATVSQLRLHEPKGDLTLTEHGMRMLGLVQPTLPQTGRSATLFFVDKQVIGGMIGSLIDQPISTSITPAPSAQQPYPALEPRTSPNTAAMPLAPCIESIRSNPCTPTPTAGGDSDATLIISANAITNPSLRSKPVLTHALPDTPITQLLRSLNVRPAQLRELADLPMDVIQLAVQDARARTGLRDQAGWIVKLLRDWRDYGWQIRPPQAPNSVDWGVLAAEYGCPPKRDLPRSTDTSGGELADAYERTPETHAPLGARADGPIVPDAAQSTFDLRNYLVCAVERKHRPVIADLAVEIRGTVAVITCATVQQRDIAATSLAPAIRSWLSQYYDRGTMHFVLRGAASAPEARTDAHDAGTFACPAWLSESQWQHLGPVLRGVLYGSTWENGSVHGRTPHMHHLMHTRYRNEVQQLVGLQTKALKRALDDGVPYPEDG